MKYLVLTTAIILTFGTAAMAQQAQQPQQPQAQPQTPAVYQGQKDKLDSNANGSVDKAEYEAFMTTAFNSLDKNKDGSLRIQEVTVVLTPQQFSAIDTDGNGRVSRDEFMKRVMADFASADKTGDGTLQ
ncbi:EF-hand domain-containing protein [Rhizobium sp. BK251]|uniref:EF-hand domain-containing protein n=1 Tax=Rhizobium sp. BK251 TaxID=2512125 RepID=UPI00104436C5|nr:EF-hand domain-containing protein [Rhizobium sp. BK251]TCL69844.1 EF hand domain-containing protein [Rhizobium sp. BK251]